MFSHSLGCLSLSWWCTSEHKNFQFWWNPSYLFVFLCRSYSGAIFRIVCQNQCHEDLLLCFLLSLIVLHSGLWSILLLPLLTLPPLQVSDLTEDPPTFYLRPLLALLLSMSRWVSMVHHDNHSFENTLNSQFHSPDKFQPQMTPGDWGLGR